MFGLGFRQIFILLIFVAFLYAAAQYVPAYVSAYQFNDFVHQEVKYAANARKTTEQVRASVMEKAKEMEISLVPRDVHVTRRGPSFTLDVDYHFPIDLRVYRQDLAFHASESGEVYGK